MKVQLIIFLVMIVLGLIQSAYRAYQKKKVVIDAQRQEREREQAILRTGRDPLAEQAAAMQRQARQDQADVMAQRQEALRELRRQQQEAQRPESAPLPVPSGGGPVTRELWPGGPVIVIGAPEQSRPAPQQQPPRPQIVARQQQPRPQQQPQRKQQQQRQRASQQQTQPARNADRHDEAYYQRERSLARMRGPQQEEQPRAAQPPVFSRPTTAQQWRAAFIASEVLGVPVSLRGQSSGF